MIRVSKGRDGTVPRFCPGRACPGPACRVEQPCGTVPRKFVPVPKICRGIVTGLLSQDIGICCPAGFQYRDCPAYFCPGPDCSVALSSRTHRPPLGHSLSARIKLKSFGVNSGKQWVSDPTLEAILFYGALKTQKNSDKVISKPCRDSRTFCVRNPRTLPYLIQFWLFKGKHIIKWNNAKVACKTQASNWGEKLTFIIFKRSR